MADETDDAFWKDLLETFKQESSEHVKSIEAHLLELEKSPNDLELLSTTFREIHSLKGAARAVNIEDVEKACQTYEDMFALLKEGKRPLVKDDFDAFHKALDGLKTLLTADVLEDDRLSLSEEIIDIISERIDADVSADTPPVDTPSQEPPEALEPPIESTQETPPEPVLEAPPPPPKETKVEELPQPKPVTEAEPSFSHETETKGRETIRISTKRLDSLLLQLEDLLLIKLILQERGNQLGLISGYLSGMKKDILSMRTIFHIMEGSLYAILQVEKEKKESANISYITRLTDVILSLQSQFNLMEETVKEISFEGKQDQFTLGKLVTNLLDDLKNFLLQPFSLILGAFPKMVRDIASSLGKDVEFQVQGETVEADKRILEELKDPLTHIIRNAIDHGIETPSDRQASGKSEKGHLILKVKQTSEQTIEIIISDDGKGIDLDKVRKSAIDAGKINEEDEPTDDELLNLLCNTDLSTNEEVSRLSGRGLGMMIVSEKVANLGGDLKVNSSLGEGCSFHIKVPIKHTTFRGIHIFVADQSFIVPTQHVKRLVKITSEDVQLVENQKVITVDEAVYPILDLANTLGLAHAKGDPFERTHLTLMLVKLETASIAFLIDKVINEQEILIKLFNKQLSHVDNIAAATLLGVNETVPVLNMVDIIGNVTQKTSVRFQNDLQEEVKPAFTDTPTILIVEDSSTSLMLLKSTVISLGYNAATAMNGEEAMNVLMKQPIHLVISDIDMPKMDGYTLTRKMRAHPSLVNVPMVLCTSLEAATHREKGLEAGADAFIEKSRFKKEEINTLLEGLLRRAA